MVAVGMSFRFDVEGLRRFRHALALDLRRSNNGPIRSALRQWGVRYLDFTRRRWLQQSRGGGDWPPLSPATIARRKKAKAGAAASGSPGILIDTGALLRGTRVGTGGNMFRDIDHGIRVGFSNSAKHPRGQASSADIAHYHQTGAGRLPVRTILVAPDQRTVTGMARDMRRAMHRVLYNVRMRGSR